MALEGGVLDSAVRVLEQECGKGCGPRAYAPLTESYRQMGRLTDAVRVAREGAAAFPRHVGIRVVLGRALADAGRTDEACEAYEEVLRLDPDNGEARAAVDRLRRQAGDACPAVSVAAAEDNNGRLPGLSEELAHLSELFAARPESPFQVAEQDFSGIATLTLAEIYARQGLTQRAVEVCETILERRPDDSNARTRLEEYRRSLSSLR